MEIIFNIILLFVIIVCSIFLGINIAKKNTSEIDSIIEAYIKTINNNFNFINKEIIKVICIIDKYRCLIDDFIILIKEQQNEINKLKEELKQLKENK